MAEEGWGEDLLKHWEQIAEQASEVQQMVMLPKKGHMEGMLVGANGVALARGLTYADAVFFAEAREAVVCQQAGLALLSAYADYVRRAVEMAGRMGLEGAMLAMLPMDFNRWVALEQEKLGQEIHGGIS